MGKYKTEKAPIDKHKIKESYGVFKESNIARLRARLFILQILNPLCALVS